MKIKNIDKLNQDLKNLSKHLSAEEIGKGGLSVSASYDGLFQVNEHHKDDVKIFFDDNEVLTMREVEDTPVIDLEVTFFDKRNGKLFIDILNVCNEYLPESSD